MTQPFLQSSLFETPQPAILGLRYLPDFINAETEAALLATIDQQPWLHDLKRRVQHYGWRYDYKARGIGQDLRIGTIPDWLAGLCERLSAERIFSSTPDQVIINEYQPSQGISAHIDCVPCFGDTIASLSLGSACVMDFTHATTGESQSRLLEPRSLLVLSGDVCYRWQHAIPLRKSDKWNGQAIPRARRISLTFRTVIA
ncbi:MAG: alpha-ketoglutarate-dependent dioxygenase AlkB [Alphaproteobacteria bacterium]|nr:alpha-ketoglutarate-dependent dioxygenase AlkB [Alphaproteobacteria bacterium]